jgi:hypothetical protein
MCIAGSFLTFLTIVNSVRVLPLGCVGLCQHLWRLTFHCYIACSDVQEWLGYRYTERCELEAAKFHFKVTAKTARRLSYTKAPFGT